MGTRPKFETIDITTKNIEQIAALFPNCISEVLDESATQKAGKNVYKKVVDFEKLKALLGNFAENSTERYDFTWPGKNASIAEAYRPIRKTLRPCKSESVDWDTTQNLYIEGDNLDVLKLLQESYLKKVKMIYIDPPYNTGNDFIYKDDFAQSAAEFDAQTGAVNEEGERMFKNTDSNGRFHSDWCSMIYSRLLLARNLLTDDGVIFISIDDNEVANLKKICDEVFGEGNFVATLNWRRSGGRQDSKYYAVIHEYVLCFAKNISDFDAGTEIKNNEIYPKYDEEKKRFYKTQLLRKWGSNSLRENRPNLYYPIDAPDGSKIYPTIYQESAASALGFEKIQGRWRWSASNLANAQKEGRIEFQRNKWGEWIAYEKIFAPQEGEERTKKYTTWLDDISNGTDSIKKIFGKTVFDYSKSAEMIVRFLKMAGTDSSSIVLDFFSGSATTAHAVMQLNAEDGGNRKFIIVQLPEPCSKDSEAFKAGYKNICEIGKERIRRAGANIRGQGTGDRGQGVANIREQGVAAAQVPITNNLEKSYGDFELQGVECLAKGNASSGGSLCTDKKAAQRGTICDVWSNAAGGGVDSVEHSGGTRAKINKRISAVFERSERLEGGTRNATVVMRANQNANASRNFASDGALSSSIENAEYANENAENREIRGQGVANIREQGIGDREQGVASTAASLTPSPSPLTPKQDTGFRVLKLDSSNMNDVYYSPSEISQGDLLDGMEQNIKSDRTDLDLLFGCVLDWGLELNMQHTTENIDGCTVHTYGARALVACFNKDVPESVVISMAHKNPLRAVFCDWCFSSDSKKINVTEIFKSMAPNATVKVI